MKTGGIVFMITGIALFVWHLFRGEWDPARRFGYASHQVMSVDSIILVVIGAVFYFWGRRRHRARLNAHSQPAFRAR
jgi:hypothetical protein